MGFVDRFRWSSAGDLFVVGSSALGSCLAFDSAAMEVLPLSPDQASSIHERYFIKPRAVMAASSKSAELFVPSQHLCVVPSFSCNLQCTYCYNQTVDRTTFLDINIAKHAVRLLFDGAKAKGETRCVLMFHGGEVFLGRNYAIMRDVVSFARQTAAEYNIGLVILSPTNGLLDDEQIEWAAENVDAVQVSVDGPPEVQGRCRVGPKGLQSLPDFPRLLAEFERRGINYAIKATVAKETTSDLDLTVRYLCSISNRPWFHVSPVWPAPGNPYGVDIEKFYIHFSQAERIAQEYGREIRLFKHSYFDSVRNRYCGMMVEPFILLPDGRVTACFEAGGNEDVVSENFIVGQHDPKVGTIMFDQQNVDKLPARTTDDIEECYLCFAKSYCGTHCPYLDAGPRPSPSERAERCALIRTLFGNALFRKCGITP